MARPWSAVTKAASKGQFSLSLASSAWSGDLGSILRFWATVNIYGKPKGRGSYVSYVHPLKWSYYPQYWLQPIGLE